MSRWVLVLLLMPWLLVGPGMCTAHGHSCGEAPSRRPHIHVGGTAAHHCHHRGHRHDRGHRHGDGGAHAAGHGHDAPADGDGYLPACPDHDEDAVYYPEILTSLSGRQSALDADGVWLVLAAPALMAADLPPRLVERPTGGEPPPRGSERPLYVRLCSLRC